MALYVFTCLGSLGVSDLVKQGLDWARDGSLHMPSRMYTIDIAYKAMPDKDRRGVVIVSTGARHRRRHKDIETSCIEGRTRPEEKLFCRCHEGSHALAGPDEHG